MGYFVKVQINRLDCRDPESVSGPDMVAMAGAVIVDGEPTGFVLPLQRMWRGSSEYLHELVFDGHSEKPEVVLSFAAWDRDRNGKWVDNREDIETVKTAIVTGIKALTGNPLIAAVPEVIVGAVDAFVSFDEDDKLADAYETLPFHDVGYSPRTQEFEVRFRGSGGTGTGFDNWNYALYLTVTHYATAPQFGTPEEEGVWQPAMKTMPAAWLGAWDGGDGGRSTVSAVISKGAVAGRLNVRIEEKLDGAASEFVTEGVLVSRVMVEAGGRHLDTDNPLLGKAFEAGPAFATAAPHPLERGLSDVGLKIEIGDHGTSERDLIAGLDDAPLLLRQQLGGDLLRLDRQALLELRHEIRGGKVVGAELRYRRPVDDVLYPERPVLLDTVLRPRVRGQFH